MSLVDLQNLINARRHVSGGDTVLPNDQDADTYIFQLIHDLLQSPSSGQNIRVQYSGNNSPGRTLSIGFQPRVIILMEQNVSYSLPYQTSMSGALFLWFAYNSGKCISVNMLIYAGASEFNNDFMNNGNLSLDLLQAQCSPLINQTGFNYDLFAFS